MADHPKKKSPDELRPVHRAELEHLIRKISEKIAADPKKAATLLTLWVHAPKGTSKKSASTPAPTKIKKSA